MGIIYGAKPIVSNGLVFCVDAKDKQSYVGSGTAWNDLVNSNNGTLTNGPVHNGDYFTFDGTNDFSTHGNNSSVQFTNNFSAEIWLRPHTVDQDTTVFSRDNGSNRQWWIFLQNNESIWFSIDDVGNAQSPTGLYTANTWFHICGTYNGSSVINYVNGTARTTTTGVSGNVNSGTAALNIGNRDNNDRHLDGDVGCARLYNRALSAAEVLQNFNAQRARFGI